MAQMPELNCSMKFIKYALFIFNLIFAISGLGILTVGILYKLELDDFSKFTEQNVILAPNLLIFIGSAVFIISFFGCCGAVQENYCMVKLYGVILLTILLMEICVGVYILVSSDENVIREQYTKVFKKYNQDNSIRESIDGIQKALECCGIDGPTDYVTEGLMTANIPNSCCKDKDISICLLTSEHWSDGCIVMIESFSKIVGAFIIVIALLEIIGIVFSWCLANAIKNNETRMPD